MRLFLALILAAVSTYANAQLSTMGVTSQSGAAPTYTGPGDIVSGAKAWWGLRAYNAAYATALGKIAHVCLPSGGSCFDVNSDASGNFNLAGQAGLSTCNNSTVLCTIQTLYDQSGASACSGPCDVTNATQSNQPVLVVPGGCPAGTGTFSASRACMVTSIPGTQFLTAPSLGAAITSIFTISVAFINPVRTTDEYLFDTTGASPRLISGSGGANNFSIYDGSSVAGAPAGSVTDNLWHAIQSVFNITTPASSNINVDGTMNTVNIGAGSVNFNFNMNLPNTNAGANPFGGYFVEYGVWPVGFTDPGQAQLINTNQHTYWGF